LPYLSGEAARAADSLAFWSRFGDLFSVPHRQPRRRAR